MTFINLIQQSHCQQCGETVAAFYHHTQGGAFEDFQIGCLQAIHKVIPLSRAYWHISTPIAKTSSKLAKLTLSKKVINSSFVEFSSTQRRDGVKSLDKVRVLLEQLSLTNQLQTLSEQEQKLLTMPNAVAVQIASEKSNLQHQLVFALQEDDAAFTAAQLNDLNVYFSHLLEAFEMFVLSKLRRRQKLSAQEAALCNSQWELIGCSDSIAGLFGKQWRAEDLPPVFPLITTQETFFRQGDWFIQLSYYWGFYSLQFMPLNQQTQGLTDKELQVCFFLQSSLSNQDIAEQMQISQKTVENHLGNIYRKLGKIGRSELFSLLNKR